MLLAQKGKPKRVYARLTEDEYGQLVNLADIAALSLSEYIRRRIFAKRIIARADVKVLSELRRLGGLLKFIHNESGGAYSEDTREAIQSITRYSRALERKILNDREDTAKAPGQQEQL